MKPEKLMIASDIHGSQYDCGRMLEAFAREGAGRLVLLGDLLYHGPRNDLPRDYNPKGVIAQLNAAKERLLCVRGNCDAQVDQMVLEFPILADYMILRLGARTVYATHGHVYNQQNPPPLMPGDVLLHGHTHVQAMDDCGGYFYLNPGSVSIPKNGNRNSYMVWEDGVFTIRDLSGEDIGSLAL